jgi:hypothetical protein
MLPSRARHRAGPAVALSLLTPVLIVLAGCGSSSSGAVTAASVPPPTESVCTQVKGVLGNGPDPDADPIGYAEAQIAPLAAIHASTPTLQLAISSLDRAFKEEFTDKASPASKAAVRKAKRALNTVCPGAAS